MAGNEIGKVALGIEFVGDIGKQIAEMAHDMGQRLAKSFGATLKGMDFSDALKEAIKGAADIDSAMKSTTDSIKEAEKSLDSMKAKLKDVVIPQVPASAVVPSPVPAVSATAPRARSKVTPTFDAGAVKAEIEQLTAVLDNTNAKLEFQQRKLAELKQSYENTFNEAKKNKLQESIINTEATILRMTKQSDDTAAKIWKLEDSLKSAGQAAQQVEPPVAQVEKKLKQTNRTLGVSGKQFKAAAKGAGITGTAFAAAGKRAGKMGNDFAAAFKRIAKQVLVFAVLYRAIRSLQDYIGSSLRTNDEYAKSLVQIRMNMKAAFAPIFQAALPAINALIKAMVTATTYIAAFTSALFGKTYKQSLEAAKGLDKARAAMDKTGKSANKLAGFDELNLLDTSTGGDDGGFMSDLQAFEMPELDVDQIQSQMDALVLGIRTGFDRAFSYIRTGWQSMTSTFGPSLQAAWSIIQPELTRWKEQFGVMFADILTLGEPLKNWWQNDLLPLWHQSIQGAATIFTGLSESVRNAFDSIWQAAFPIIEKFVSDGLPRITEFAAGVQGIFLDMFGIVKQIFDDIWQGVIDPVMQLISQIVRDTLDILFGWWDTWGKKIVANISDTLGRIKELWNNLWEKMLKPIVTRMLEMLTKLWNDHLKDLVKEIGNFVGKLVTAAQDIFNEFIMPIVNWLVDKLGPIFAEIFAGVIDVVGNALGSIIDAANEIIKALGGIVDFIAGVFTGDWEKAWNGIETFTQGIADAIAGLFKGAVNVIIDTFNWLIKQLNKIKIDIPDWVPGVGGQTFGINIPTIPRLAKGGLVQGPTLAMVGDNPHANVDPEVVAPLSKLQEMLGGVGSQEVVEVLYMILAALQDYARRPVILEANGTQLAKIIDNARDDRNRRAGRTLAMT